MRRSFFRHVLRRALGPCVRPVLPVQYADGTFTFTTRGYGHCVGLSQHGAQSHGRRRRRLAGNFDLLFPGCEVVGKAKGCAVESILKIQPCIVGGGCLHPPAGATSIAPYKRQPPLTPSPAFFQYAHDECRQQTAAQQATKKSMGLSITAMRNNPPWGAGQRQPNLHSQRTGQAAACHAGGHHAQRITQRKGQRTLGYKGCPHQQVLRRGATLLPGESGAGTAGRPAPRRWAAPCRRS